MVYFETDYLTVHYNEEFNGVLMEWKTFTTSEELKAGLNKGLACINEKKLTKWLADVRELGAISEEDQKWSNEDWFPRALQSGIKRMAVIVSDDIFNQMTVEEIMLKVKAQDFISQYFDSVDKAKKWLKNE